MGCWELFDLNDLPEDANLIGAKWVLKRDDVVYWYLIQ
jgi:hypothetical protein